MASSLLESSALSTLILCPPPSFLSSSQFLHSKSPRPIIVSSLIQPSYCDSTVSATSSRRQVAIGITGLVLLSQPPLSARADIEEDYTAETMRVISQIRSTLVLDKNDPAKGEAVKALRQSSNEWVAKYRREKRFAGKPSYSNMYSVLNAVSGHYISYGDGYPIPPKRKNLILEEVDIAERALSRGR
eukprot:c22185_g1_i1 orf=25-585(-)